MAYLIMYIGGQQEERGEKNCKAEFDQIEQCVKHEMDEDVMAVANNWPDVEKCFVQLVYDMSLFQKYYFFCVYSHMV